MSTMLQFLLCMALAACASAATLGRLEPAGAEPAAQRPLQSRALQRSLVQREIEAWKQSGHPDFIQFYDDEEEPEWAAVVGSQPELSDEYEDGVVFHLFTKQNDSDSDGTAFTTFDSDTLMAAGWDSKLDTKVIIHGFTNTIYSPVIQMIKNAYLEEGPFNVIGVDWGALCVAPLYISARMHVWGTGQRVSELLNFLVSNGLTSHDKIHVIGHSLGAHVSGIAAKLVDGDKVGRVTGLDPAMPLFLLTPASDRLSNTDAEVVDVIHTCGGRLGFATDLGTSDFYPNGGDQQPGCGADLFGICSHSRSYRYFAESITDGGFLSVPCDAYSDFEQGLCTNNTINYMGEETLPEAGTFFLSTGSEFPYNTNATSNTQ